MEVVDMVKIRVKGFDEVEFEGISIEEYKKLKERLDELTEQAERILRFLHSLYDDLGELIEEIQEDLNGDDE